MLFNTVSGKKTKMSKYKPVQIQPIPQKFDTSYQLIDVALLLLLL